MSHDTGNPAHRVDSSVHQGDRGQQATVVFASSECQLEVRQRGPSLHASFKALNEAADDAI
jgi:hypothetical protein